MERDKERKREEGKGEEKVREVIYHVKDLELYPEFPEYPQDPTLQAQYYFHGPTGIRPKSLTTNSIPL